MSPLPANGLPGWNECELATLASDSLADREPGLRGALLRGASQRRNLSFRASGLTVELSITPVGQIRQLTGQLLPRQSACVDIRSADRLVTVRADEMGRFIADSVPAGPVSIRCHLGTSDELRPVVTGWISI